MSHRELAIPLGSTVLVTGANGYVASQIIDVLLQLGYKVRGTVRSAKPWLDQLFEGRYGKGKFQSVVVPDLEAEDAYNEVIKGVSGFLHVATDSSLSPDPSKVVPRVINYAINALKAAAKEPSVKRFILTSSSIAAVLPTPNNEGLEVDENSYDDTAVKLAWDDSTPANTKPLLVYAASKTEAERESWKWMQENKPGFVFNTILPSFNTGPILDSEIAGSTMGFTRNLLKGDPLVWAIFMPQYYIDVRDTARLHVAGLLDPAIKDERIFGFVHEFNWTDIVALLRKLRPNNKSIPDPPSDAWRDKTLIKPKERAEEILRSFWNLSWTKLETSLEDAIVGWD